MFVSGRELSRRFYQEQVHPVLHIGYPGLPYSAALLGRGSEVLGFDDEMSRDHNWEPRVLLFLGDADHARYGKAVDRSLRDGLPARFAGYPTQFSLSTLRAYDDGIHIDATGTSVTDNTTNRNRDLGIQAVPGVIDGGGNTARGNGNPAQCENVLCR